MIGDDPDFVHQISTTVQPSLVTKQQKLFLRYVAILVTTQSDPTPGNFVIAIYPSHEQSSLMAMGRAETILGVGAFLLVAIVGWLLAGQLLAPIRSLRDTSRSINEHDLTRRIPVDGNDEISDLAGTFNTNAGPA